MCPSIFAKCSSAPSAFLTCSLKVQAVVDIWAFSQTEVAPSAWSSPMSNDSFSHLEVVYIAANLSYLSREFMSADSGPALWFSGTSIVFDVAGTYAAESHPC